MNGAVRAKYETQLSNQVANLPAIADKLGKLVGGSIADDLARYYVIRDEGGQRYAFPVYLIRGQDGRWRIGEM